jgi:hypothetical protein
MEDRFGISFLPALDYRKICLFPYKQAPLASLGVALHSQHNFNT